MANVSGGGGYTPPPPPRPSTHTVTTKSSDSVAPAPARTSSGGASGGYYTIRSGDTLGAIAARYGMSVNQLAALNGISNPNRIFAGQRIRVSGTARSTTSSSSGARTASSSGGGGSTSKSSSTSSADNPAAEKAAEFGYTLGFFNINSELKNLLNQATKANWSSARFVAALQNTHWFRTTQESMRKYQALKVSDPQTFKENLSNAYNHIMLLGGQMGAVLTNSQAMHLADQSMQMAWTEDDLRRVLDGMLTVKNGLYQGAAGAFQSQFNQVVGDYGVNVSDATMGQWVKAAVLGGTDVNTVTNQAQQLAISKYAALADRIKAGETVRQIADPYVQSYGKILEVDPNNINLSDPLIQHALTSKDAKGQPTTQTVYDFENTLRNDPRWSKTQNAQDLMSSTAHSILSNMGLV